MDHTTFQLFDVPRREAAALRLSAAFPLGVDAAVALVGRTPAGELGWAFQQLPAGGSGSVTLRQVPRFDRVTAVLVNADVEQMGLGADGDWRFKGDRAQVRAQVSTDASGPAIAFRDPAPRKRRVPRDADVRVTFSEPVTGVSASSLRLTDRKGRVLPAKVRYDAATRTATLDPSRTLSERAPYTAVATDAIKNQTGDSLAASSWSFTTGRWARRRARARPTSCGAACWWRCARATRAASVSASPSFPRAAPSAAPRARFARGGARACGSA
jgi:hypothetical protein